MKPGEDEAKGCTERARPSTDRRTPRVSGRGIIVLRRRQKAPAINPGSTDLHIIESGCLTIEASLPGDRRQICMVLYPGDVFSAETAPPLASLSITAGLPSSLARSGVMAAEGANASGSIELTEALTRQLARSNLHCMALGRLTGEERVATALIEMALFLGHAVSGGYTFELPMSRRDLADYLSLNPDTLSRMVSRLKARKLISTPGRRHMIITDYAGLALLTPLADALLQLSKAAKLASHQAAAIAR